MMFLKLKSWKKTCIFKEASIFVGGRLQESFNLQGWSTWSTSGVGKSTLGVGESTLGVGESTLGVGESTLGVGESSSSGENSL
ncbi:hypothetical protein E5676_scaffold1738G001120 [Cucumis melo var. makuwa]|uniref:Uncharacterized protein n=1 Tax=Cucumis melo var. makuwa TaxID=1194695 RepID=A0A5D3BTM9_CUCMM|nr:hypothetical protein E5676_scaffold1738G001120 [Cucumis melo var. makuwa]